SEEEPGFVGGGGAIVPFSRLPQHAGGSRRSRSRPAGRSAAAGFRANNSLVCSFQVKRISTCFCSAAHSQDRFRQHRGCCSLSRRPAAFAKFRERCLLLKETPELGNHSREVCTMADKLDVGKALDKMLSGNEPKSRMALLDEKN